MRGLPSILSLFRNKFNKFNNTLKSDFWRRICHYVRNVVMDVITFPVNLLVYRFYCMALFHSKTRRHMINGNSFILAQGHVNVHNVLVLRKLYLPHWADNAQTNLLSSYCVDTKFKLF